MTQRDHIVKWLMYALVLLPVLVLDVMVLPRYPLLGISPMLLPLAVAAVATLEGSVAGAGFGLTVGLLCNVAYGAGGAMTLLLPIGGALSGIATRYALRQNGLGCFICAFFVLAVIDVWQVGVRMFWGQEPAALLRVAGLEILFSLPFVALVFPLNRWVHRRVGGSAYF